MVKDRSSLTRRNLMAGMLGALATPAMANAPLTSLFPLARPGAPDPAPAAASALRAPRGTLDALLARSGLSGQTAVIAVDAETGATVEEHRGDLVMPPASTAKAITAMYALQTLGLEHRFVTRIEATGGGEIRNGELAGDLVLRGGGDPTLQTADLARLAEALVQRGLRRVSGRFLVDDSALPGVAQIDRGQPVSAGYNPSVSGLNLNFNRVHFSWETREGQARLALDARSEREVPPVSVIAIRAAARDLPVYTHGIEGGREHWTVAASALRSPGSRWLPVRVAAAYAGDVLRALLAARGCQIPPAQTARVAQGAVLAEHRSAALRPMVAEMLRYSTNITAESLGLAATLRLGGRPGGLEPSAARMNAWIGARYDAPGMALIDHSGLGPGSRITPRAMARYLVAARREGVLPDLLRLHPMRDSAGRENAGHPVTVRAKTGTLNFVSSLAGYAQPRGGRAIAFAIFSADMNRRRRISEADGEQPSGTRAWAGQARGLQQALIERWAGLSG